MTQLATGRTGVSRGRRPAVVGVITLILAGVIGILVHQWPGPAHSVGGVDSGAGATITSDGVVDTADGVLPDGVTVLETGYPGVDKLEPELLAALRQAATSAADDGVVMVANSGWRSPEYQDQLLQTAVAQYGSQEEAARWVATADTSVHVTGGAVDVDAAAAAWLSEHGAMYGLCPVYRNEPWHYELRPDAVGGRCPRMYDDPTQDPRLQS